MEFPDGTVIDATGPGSTLATAYPEKGYVSVSVHTFEGERVTMRLKGWEVKALISTLQRVYKNLHK